MRNQQKPTKKQPKQGLTKLRVTEGEIGGNQAPGLAKRTVVSPSSEPERQAQENKGRVESFELRGSDGLPMKTTNGLKSREVGSLQKEVVRLGAWNKALNGFAHAKAKAAAKARAKSAARAKAAAEVATAKSEGQAAGYEVAGFVSGLLNDKIRWIQSELLLMKRLAETAEKMKSCNDISALPALKEKANDATRTLTTLNIIKHKTAQVEKKLAEAEAKEEAAAVDKLLQEVFECHL